MKKFLAVLLTLVMALSVCVPAFAELPPMPKPDEIIGGIKDGIDQQITEKINATYVVLEGYLNEHKLPVEPVEPVKPVKPVEPILPEGFDPKNAPKIPTSSNKLPGETAEQFNLRQWKAEQDLADYNVQKAIYDKQTKDYNNALNEYNKANATYETDKATYNMKHLKWEEECFEWAKNLLQGQGMSHEAAKVAVTVMYNQGTFNKSELSYAKVALKNVTTQLELSKKELAIAKTEQKKNRVALEDVLTALTTETDPQEKNILTQKKVTLTAAVKANNSTVKTQFDEVLKNTELSAKAEALYPELHETYALSAEENKTLSAALNALKNNYPTNEQQDVFAKAQIKAVQNILDVQKGKINKAQYDTVMKAIDDENMYVSPAPQVTVDKNIYKLVVEAKDGAAVTDALTALKVPVKFMNTYIDKIVASKFILESVGDLGKKQVAKLGDPNVKDENTSEGQTDAEKEESASGIKGFINSILDKFKGGKGDADKGEVDNTENGSTSPTGDVAIYSVLGLAAVAGATVVLTKKKKNVK